MFRKKERPQISYIPKYKLFHLALPQDNGGMFDFYTDDREDIEDLKSVLDEFLKTNK